LNLEVCNLNSKDNRTVAHYTKQCLKVLTVGFQFFVSFSQNFGIRDMDRYIKY